MSAPTSWPHQNASPDAFQPHVAPGLDRLRVLAPAAHAFPSSSHFLNSLPSQYLVVPNSGVAQGHPGGGVPGGVGAYMGSYGHPHMFSAMAMGVPLPGTYAPPSTALHPTTPSTATSTGMGSHQLPSVSLADMVAATAGGTGSFWGSWMARYAATGGIAAMNARLNPNMSTSPSGVGHEGTPCLYPGVRVGGGPEDIHKQVGRYPGWQVYPRPHAGAAGTRAMKAEPSQTVDAGGGGAWGGGGRTWMASRGSSPSPGGSSEEER